MVGSEEHPLEKVHLADCQRRYALRDQVDHPRLALHDRIHKQHAPAAHVLAIAQGDPGRHDDVGSSSLWMI